MVLKEYFDFGPGFVRTCQITGEVGTRVQLVRMSVQNLWHEKYRNNNLRKRHLLGGLMETRSRTTLNRRKRWCNSSHLDPSHSSRPPDWSYHGHVRHVLLASLFNTFRIFLKCLSEVLPPPHFSTKLITCDHLQCKRHLHSSRLLHHPIAVRAGHKLTTFIPARMQISLLLIDPEPRS